MIFSESLPNVISTPLGEFGYWSSLIPLVSGILLKALTPYVLSEAETATKVLESITKSKQLIFNQIHRILIDGRGALDASDLRGDPNESPPRPDKIAIFYESVVKSSIEIFHLERLKKTTRRAYTLIVTTIILAFLGTVAGFLSSSSELLKTIVAVVSISLFASQILTIVVLRYCKSKIEGYD